MSRDVIWKRGARVPSTCRRIFIFFFDDRPWQEWNWKIFPWNSLYVRANTFAQRRGPIIKRIRKRIALPLTRMCRKSRHGGGLTTRAEQASTCYEFAFTTPVSSLLFPRVYSGCNWLLPRRRWSLGAAKFASRALLFRLRFVSPGGQRAGSVQRLVKTAWVAEREGAPPRDAKKLAETH